MRLFNPFAHHHGGEKPETNELNEEKEIASIAEQIASLAQQIALIDERTIRLEGKLMDIQTSIDNVTQQLSAGNTTLATIAPLLTTIDANVKAALSHAQATGNFDALNAAVATNSQAITAISTALQQLQTDVPVPPTPPTDTTGATTTPPPSG